MLVFLQALLSMAISLGEGKSFAVCEDGVLLSWGKNDLGELGVGDFENRLHPTQVPIPTLSGHVRQVSCADHYTAIVTDEGDLYLCGACGPGFDDSDGPYTTTPTRVDRDLFEGEAIVMAACGYSFMAVVTEHGGVFTFGSGHYGSLGHGDQEDHHLPRRVPPANFHNESIVMVACGFSHTVALSDRGNVFTWGDGESGQLGHGDTQSQLAPQQVEAGRFGDEKVVFVATGSDNTAVLTAGGRLYTFGCNLYGMLGHGDARSRLVPTLVEEEAFGGSPAVMVSCGNLHTMVVTEDGALWACGTGLDGELGIDDTQPRNRFVRVGLGQFEGVKVVVAAAGNGHSAAVTEDGVFWGWGQVNHTYVQSNFYVTVPVSTHNFKIGRCNKLPQDHALALAFGVKRQKEGYQTLSSLDGKDLIIKRIRAWCASVLPGVGQNEGIMRMAGGYPAWRERQKNLYD